MSNSIEIIKEECVQFVDVQLIKSVNLTNVEMGESVVWTITVSNQGPTMATGVTATDALPDGLEISNITASMGAFNPTTLVWNIGNLAVGQSETAQITTVVTAAGTLSLIHI